MSLHELLFDGLNDPRASETALRDAPARDFGSYVHTFMNAIGGAMPGAS
jgi:hypothetical protein